MLFDSTLRKDLSRSFGGTLIVILTIVLTMMLIRTLGMAAGGKVSPLRGRKANTVRISCGLSAGIEDSFISICEAGPSMFSITFVRERLA